MPIVPLILRPGINLEETRNLNEGGFSDSLSVRFFQGLPEKEGGFEFFCQTLPAQGATHALKAWTSLAGVSLLGIGANFGLNVFAAEAVYNITPQTILAFIPIVLSTTAGSTTITITDAVNAPSVGEWLQILDPVSVGGLILYGSYGVVSSGGGQYQITAARAATQTIVGQGSARNFHNPVGSPIVTITLPNHGLFTGQIVSIPDATAIDGFTLQGNYIATVVDQHTYTILGPQPASAARSLNENANGTPGAGAGPGNIQLTFFTTAAGVTPAAGYPTTRSTLDNWGEFLMWNPRGGPVFVWQPALGYATPAANAATVPQSNTTIFVATQQQQLFCLGTVNRATGLFDPMLVAWSDVGDYTDFVPLTTNQAGSFRLTAGSMIVGGLALAGGNLIWTDKALYMAFYQGQPFIWGFQPQGINCGLLSMQGFGTLNQKVFWISQNQFYGWEGGVPQIIPCTVWDAVFKSINPARAMNAVCETNSFFNEVSWEVPQIGGTTTRARYQVDTGVWDYSTLPSGAFLPRHAWIDQSVFGGPLAADSTGAVWQHEKGTDAGAATLLSSLKTGFINIAEEDQVIQINGIYPDIKFTADGRPGPGTVEVLVHFFPYTQDPARVKGPFAVNSQTRFIPARGRAQALQFEFRSRDNGSWWRIGKMEYRGAPDGRRP